MDKEGKNMLDGIGTSIVPLIVILLIVFNVGGLGDWAKEIIGGETMTSAPAQMPCLMEATTVTTHMRDVGEAYVWVNGAPLGKKETGDTIEVSPGDAIYIAYEMDEFTGDPKGEVAEERVPCSGSYHINSPKIQEQTTEDIKIPTDGLEVTDSNISDIEGLNVFDLGSLNLEDI